MQIRLLGEVTALTHDAVPIDVGPPKCQALLAALALSAGSAVPVGRLLELVWGDDPPRTADKTLQSYVTRLRKGLGADSVVRVGAAYRLDVDAEAVDVLRFQSALDNGDTDRALAEWTGTPLAGLVGHGLVATTDRLVEQWLGAVEADLAGLVDHDPGSAIGRLTELTAEYPFREGLWALLMTAHYRLGQQAEALAAFGKARLQLIEQLGVEPGPRLRRLETAILNHEADLTVVHRPSLGVEPSMPTGTVTFASSGIAGVNELWAVGRAEATAAVERHAELVRTLVGQHQGFVIVDGGERFVVAFHRGGDALAWAEAVQGAMRAEPWSEGCHISVRIGLHTGDAELHDDRYWGPAPDVAGRVADGGNGGQTLVSDATAKVLDAAERSNLVDLGVHRLPELHETMRLWQIGTATFPTLVDRSSSALPVQNTALFGRAADIDEVIDLVRSHRLVTLTGPGGTGKTRLALAVAAELATEFGDGVFFASLASIDHPQEIARVVGDAIGLTVGSIDGSSVARLIASRDLLIVIDNCEHVIDGVSALVDAALSEGAHGRVLATSREALDLGGEWTFAVPPLAATDLDSPGVDLLIDRGRQARPDLVTDDVARAALAEIGQRLDGIPLALELAAAQLTHLSPTEVVERLDDRFQLLGHSRRGLPRQQQTLRATMDWSWELLGADEREVIQQLSVFAGGWTLAAAEGVCRVRSGASVTVVLRALVAQSMILTDTEGDRTRYRMLETVRLYAQERLREAGEERASRQRHAAYFCRRADAVSFSDRFMLVRPATRWAREVDNIVAIVEWLREEGRLDEAAALITMPALTWRFLPMPKPLREAIRELLARSLPPARRGGLLIAGLDAGSGRVGLSGRNSRAMELVELGREGNDDAMTSAGLIMAGSPLGVTDPDRAERLLTEAIDHAGRAGDQRLEAFALTMLVGVESFGRQDYDRARSIAELAESMATDDGFETHALLSHLLTLGILAGDWTSARSAYRRLLAFHELVGHPLGWSDAIDDAVFAAEFDEPGRQSLVSAVDALQAAGGDPADWPDLLVIPLGQACRLEDWGRAQRIVAAVQSSSRSRRPLASPHATAYYIAYRRRIPSSEAMPTERPSPDEVLTSELLLAGD